ncbi:MAG TPA: hypothetical protein VF458_15705 [Ktedonobacteraceae bacterium]
MSNNAHDKAAQEQHFADIFARLHEQDIEQFYAHYQLWVLRRRLPLLEQQIEVLREHLAENQRTVEMMQPSALALAVLVRLQSNGVNNTDVLDLMLDRGEDWLDRMMQRLDYCEQVEDFIQGDYTQWCIRSLEGAYDWIDSLLGSIKEDENPQKNTGGEIVATEEQLLHMLSQDDDDGLLAATLKQPTTSRTDASESASANQETGALPAELESGEIQAAAKTLEPAEALEPEDILKPVEALEPVETLEAPESLEQGTGEAEPELLGWKDLEDLEAPEGQPVPWYSVDLTEDGSSSTSDEQASSMDDWIRVLQAEEDTSEGVSSSEFAQPTDAGQEEETGASAISEENEPVEPELSAQVASEPEAVESELSAQVASEPESAVLSSTEIAQEKENDAPASAEAIQEPESALFEYDDTTPQESAPQVDEKAAFEDQGSGETVEVNPEPAWSALSEEESNLEHEPILSTAQAAPVEVSELEVDEAMEVAEDQGEHPEVTIDEEAGEIVEVQESASETVSVAETPEESANQPLFMEEAAQKQEEAGEMTVDRLAQEAEEVSVDELEKEANVEETQELEVAKKEEIQEGEAVHEEVAQEPEVEDTEKTLELRLRPPASQAAPANGEIETAAIVNDILDAEDEQEEQLAWYEYLDVEEISGPAIPAKSAQDAEAARAVAEPGEVEEETEIEGRQNWKGSLADEETAQLPITGVQSEATGEARETIVADEETLAPGTAREQVSVGEHEETLAPIVEARASAVEAPRAQPAPAAPEAPPKKIGFWRRLFGFARRKKR